MIDIHSHFLPFMDDGANNSEESISMLKDAYSQGVTVAVATSHCRIHYENSVEAFLRERKEAFEQIPKNENDIPKILLGAEVLLDHDISQDDDIKKLCIDGTDYLLVEFNHMGIGVTEEDCERIYNLTLLGIKPIIAHIDRYPHSTRIMSYLDDVDVKYQINAGRFLSRAERKDLSKLLKTGKSFIVASDMHNMKSRPCQLKSAYEMSKKHFPKFTEDLFINNSEKLFSK